MPRRSRYADTPAFAPDPLGRTTFRGLLPRRISTPEGRLEHTVRAGERLDRLALNYLNADRDWWRIADANPGFLSATDMVLETGEEPDGLDREGMVGRRIVVSGKEV